MYFPHSLGAFYEAITQYLGFPNYGDEYKVMGLAPYGEPVYLDAMHEIVRLMPKGRFELNLAYCFDRKEVKQHGDRGLLVGKVPEPEDRIVMIDDVITDGATKVEAIRRLGEITEAKVTDLVISLNRRERDAAGGDPIAALEASSGVRVHSIVTVEQVLEALHNRPLGGKVLLDDRVAEAMRGYLAEYGVGG